MKSIAFAALIAAPVLSKKLAQQAYDDSYAEPVQAYEAPAYAEEVEADAYSVAHSISSYSRSSVSISSVSHSSVSYSSVSHSYGSHGAGSTYSVSDHDQYHNDEDNNQSPYTKKAHDTTTQNVNFRINLLKNGYGGGRRH